MPLSLLLVICDQSHFTFPAFTSSWWSGEQVGGQNHIVQLMSGHIGCWVGYGFIKLWCKSSVLHSNISRFTVPQLSFKLITVLSLGDDVTGVIMSTSQTPPFAELGQQHLHRARQSILPFQNQMSYYCSISSLYEIWILNLTCRQANITTNFHANRIKPCTKLSFFIALQGNKWRATIEIHGRAHIKARTKCYGKKWKDT